jgi:HEAT repeat protein
MRAFLVVCLGAALLAPAGRADDDGFADVQRYLKRARDGLNDPDPAVRRRAAAALEKYGNQAVQIVGDLTPALRDRDEGVRAAAAKALAAPLPLGCSWSAVPALQAALRDVSPAVRAEAAGALAVYGALAAGAAPDLTRALDDPDPEVRRRAMGALKFMEPAARPAVPKIVQALKATGPGAEHLRNAAESCLARLGPEARAAVPDLLEALKGPDPKLRGAAMVILGTIGDEAAVGPLTAVLKDPGQQEYWPGAAGALGGVGPPARAAVPLLLGALEAKGVRDPELAKRLRLAAARALGRIAADPEAAVPALARMARDKGLADFERTQPLQALRGFGPKAAPALPALLETVRDPQDWLCRKDAFAALAAVGPAAVPALTELLQDRSPDIRLGAVRALAEVGVGVKGVVPALLEAERDDDEKVREEARRALGAGRRRSSTAGRTAHDGSPFSVGGAAGGAYTRGL